MISVVVPTLNAEAGLASALAALVPAVVDGLIREVIVVDGGSTDATLAIADACGATILRTDAGRGPQLIAGANAARGPWLLFLHSDTVLQSGWEREARAFIDQIETARSAPAAAVFRFALDDAGIMPRLVEWGVGLRGTVFRLPYGDQGLLLPAALYRQIGGYRPIPIMEDVDIVRRLGRSRTKVLGSRAVTSSARYRRDGYVVRIARNLGCLTLYALQVPIPIIERCYTGRRRSGASQISVKPPSRKRS